MASDSSYTRQGIRNLDAKDSKKKNQLQRQKNKASQEVFCFHDWRVMISETGSVTVEKCVRCRLERLL
jgi:hypothetical protein